MPSWHRSVNSAETAFWCSTLVKSEDARVWCITCGATTSWLPSRCSTPLSMTPPPRRPSAYSRNALLCSRYASDARRSHPALGSQHSTSPTAWQAHASGAHASISGCVSNASGRYPSLSMFHSCSSSAWLSCAQFPSAQPYSGSACESCSSTKITSASVVMACVTACRCDCDALIQWSYPWMALHSSSAFPFRSITLSPNSSGTGASHSSVQMM